MRISTRPISIKVSKSAGLTGINFVRLALISRSAQRRRIAVSKSNPVHGELVCSAIAPREVDGGRSSTFSVPSSAAGSLTTTSDAASSATGRSTEGASSSSAETGEPLRKSAAIFSSSDVIFAFYKPAHLERVGSDKAAPSSRTADVHHIAVALGCIRIDKSRYQQPTINGNDFAILFSTSRSGWTDIVFPARTAFQPQILWRCLVGKVHHHAARRARRNHIG